MDSINNNVALLKEKAPILYEIGISVLALISVILVCLDLGAIIDISIQPFAAVDLSILGIFWIDYFYRLSKGNDKKTFVKKNILDLIAIIPFNEIFALFRVARIFRIARLVRLTKSARLIRMFAFLGVFNKKMKRFLKTNGFIYMVYIAGILIIVSGLLFSYVENISLLDAFWWSIVTCTTVGYGDIFPVTAAGRMLAIFLMVFGIGFIGMLTGTITTYFTKHLYSDDVTIHTIYDDLSKEQQRELFEFALAMKIKNKEDSSLS